MGFLAVDVQRCRGKDCPEKEECKRFLFLDEKARWLDPIDTFRDSSGNCRFKIKV